MQSMLQELLALSLKAWLTGSDPCLLSWNRNSDLKGQRSSSVRSSSLPTPEERDICFRASALEEGAATGSPLYLLGDQPG